MGGEAEDGGPVADLGSVTRFTRQKSVVHRRPNKVTTRSIGFPAPLLGDVIVGGASLRRLEVQISGEGGAAGAVAGVHVPAVGLARAQADGGGGAADGGVHHQQAAGEVPHAQPVGGGPGGGAPAQRDRAAEWRRIWPRRDKRDLCRVLPLPTLLSPEELNQLFAGPRFLARVFLHPVCVFKPVGAELNAP